MGRLFATLASPILLKQMHGPFGQERSGDLAVKLVDWAGTEYGSKRTFGSYKSRKILLDIVTKEHIFLHLMRREIRVSAFQFNHTFGTLGGGVLLQSLKSVIKARIWGYNHPHDQYSPLDLLLSKPLPANLVPTSNQCLSVLPPVRILKGTLYALNFFFHFFSLLPSSLCSNGWPLQEISVHILH